MHPRRFVSRAGLLLIFLGVCGCDDDVPKARHSAGRVAEIAALDVARSGRVVLRALYPGRGHASRERVTVVVSAVRAAVEDTEIRGLLDGTVKHHYNQGTAYHMRLGRRYSGPFGGQYELKRALIRWPLPALAPGGRVVSARATFFVERFFDRSRMARGECLPLHLYGYPMDGGWGAGHGGEERDIFSAPAPGEASWLVAQAGIREWPAPGALAHAYGGGGPCPLAVATIVEGDADAVLGGEGLRRFAARCLEEGRSLDLLLKIDDEEEDRWGTQFAVLTSNFGDLHDHPELRPRLELELEFRATSTRFEEDFVLEGGRDKTLFRQELPAPAILCPKVIPEGAGLPPEIWIRGGNAGQAGGGWQKLDQPRSVDYEWVEAKLTTAVRRLPYGTPFRVEILEPWVVPGPREKQRPELVLVAPSGRIYRTPGEVLEGLRYRMEHTPDEPGLWKYGWCFSPAPEVPAEAHRGQGVFYVDARSRAAIARIATALAAELGAKSAADLSDQYRFNAFTRLAAEHRLHGEEEEKEADRWIGEVRRALPPELDRSLPEN